MTINLIIGRKIIINFKGSDADVVIIVITIQIHISKYFIECGQ